MKCVPATSLVWVAIVFLGGAAVADAGVFYVSNSGSDSNPGSPTAPFATIAHAIGVATSGDDIRVAAGTYLENIIMTDGVDVLGGWSLDFSVRDLAVHLSVIDGSAGGSVLKFVDATAELSGFTMQNGTGTPFSDLDNLSDIPLNNPACPGPGGVDEATCNLVCAIDPYCCDAWMT